MHRTTLLLPESLKAACEQLAKSKNISFGELVRQQLQLALSRSRTQEPDAIFSKFEPYTGKAPTNLALNHDDELYGPVTTKHIATSAGKKSTR